MDWSVLALGVLVALVLLGALFYPLGWRGGMLWVLACGLATLLIGPYTNTGGCDGGLCIFGYLLHFLFLLLIWVVLWFGVLISIRAWRKQSQ